MCDTNIQLHLYRFHSYIGKKKGNYFLYNLFVSSSYCHHSLLWGNTYSLPSYVVKSVRHHHKKGSATRVFRGFLSCLAKWERASERVGSAANGTALATKSQMEERNFVLVLSIDGFYYDQAPSCRWLLLGRPSVPRQIYTDKVAQHIRFSSGHVRYTFPRWTVLCVQSLDVGQNRLEMPTADAAAVAVAAAPGLEVFSSFVFSPDIAASPTTTGCRFFSFVFFCPRVVPFASRLPT